MQWTRRQVGRLDLAPGSILPKTRARFHLAPLLLAAVTVGLAAACSDSGPAGSPSATISLRVEGGVGQVGVVVSNAEYAETFGRLACGGDIPDPVCSATHDLDAAGPVDLIFTAWPGNGWLLTGWSGDCIASGSLTATLRVDSEKSYECVATFEGNNAGGGGYCNPFANAYSSLDAAWDAIPLRVVGTASQSAVSQQAGTGPLPEAYIRRHTTTLDLPVDPAARVSQIAVAYLRNDLAYAPSVQGPLPRLNYIETQSAVSNPDSLDVEWGIALQQGSVVYTAKYGTFRSSVPQPPDFLTGALTPDGFNPSITGAPIRFGYYRMLVTARNPAARSEVVHDIGSWNVSFCY